MEVTIEINRMSLYARHGVMAQERVVGNTFEVTAHLRYPLTEGDDIARTLNYAEAAEVIKAVMAEPAELLETVVKRLKDALLARFPAITGGMVKVAKLSPPIPGFEADSVAVKLAW